MRKLALAIAAIAAIGHAYALSPDERFSIPAIGIFGTSSEAFPPLVEPPEAPVEQDAGFTGNCLLEVDRAPYIDGPCTISMGDGGAFSIGTLNKAAHYDSEGKIDGYIEMFWAHVYDVEGGKAGGYWAGEPFASHGPSLGDLTRDGACWANDRAKVCAWK